MLSDLTLFKAGEVWDWCGIMYLLLHRDMERELSVTVKAANQQCWRAMDLDTGRVHEVRLHTEVFNQGTSAACSWVMW